MSEPPAAGDRGTPNAGAGRSARPREFGLGRGKVFPASAARQLENPLRRFLQSPDRLARRLRLSPDGRVLELGCGPGFFSPALARRVPRGLLVLFDLQVEMLLRARPKPGRTGEPDPSAVQGDALALPFRDDTFHAATLVTVLGEVPGPEDCLRELHRVLRTGGVLAIAETRLDPDFHSLARVRELAGRAGLRYERKHGIAPAYTAIFTKT